MSKKKPPFAVALSGYVTGLAGDRDKYLNQRNRAAKALRAILPLAESFMKGAPSHPDQAKLEDARAILHEIDAGDPISRLVERAKKSS